MIKYQYQIVRYVHDQFTGEFANLGVIVYAPTSKFLQCKMVNRYARLSNFFGEVNGTFLLSSIRQVEQGIKSIQKDLDKMIEFTKAGVDLAAITTILLPKDDSALQLGDTQYALDIDPERALLDLFERLVEKYNSDEKTESHTDGYAWKAVYKTYFDKVGVTPKLKKHSVATDKDNIDFEKAWKNGVWNCYQPLSFDLRSDDSIKSKVYKWSGIIKALQTAEEELHVVFLTTRPHHGELQSFIEETLTLNEKKLTVEIVDEAGAEQFAAKVRKEMEDSKILPKEDDLPF